MHMTPITLLRAAAAASIFLGGAVAQDTLNQHKVVLDDSGKLLSWVQPQQQAYGRVVRLAWDFLLNTVPVESNGLKSYFTYCCLQQDAPRHELAAQPRRRERHAGRFGGGLLLTRGTGAWWTWQRLCWTTTWRTGPPRPDGCGATWSASSDAGAVDYRSAIEFRYDPNVGAETAMA